MKLTHNQLIFNAVFCLTLLMVIIWALYDEYNRPWKKYQKEFNQLSPDTQIKEVKIRQLWLQDFGETDRCITCHQGIDNMDFTKEFQPLKTHTGDYLKVHPVEKYGCVICHSGQGPALTVNAAHGEVKNWTKPLLKNPYVQSSCGRCHFMDQELPLSSELAGASKFIEGWRLFKEYSCIGCHKLPGYKRPDRISPALTSMSSKVKRDWLVRWLKNPKDYLPKTKMPRFKLSNEEINYIVSYLLSLGDMYSEKPTPIINLHDKNEQNRGEKLVESLGCLGCHAVGEKGNAFAPEFTDIGNKVTPEWLYQFLKKPKAYDTKTIIPDFIISEKDIPSIVAYLMSLKKPQRNKESYVFSTINEAGLSEDIVRGKKLVKDLGCTGCHEIENFLLGYDAPPLDGIGDKRVDELVFSNIADVEKTLINWLKIKVMAPGKFATDKIVTRMPDYDFDEEQAESLVTFLLSIRKDSVPPKYVKTLINPDEDRMRGKKILEKYNCFGCHTINNKAGDIGPDLTKEAKKSRSEWLFSFLKKPHKIRPVPILKARMPNFNLSDEEVNDIIEYLAFISVEPYPYDVEPKKEIYSDDIRVGEKLYLEIFACSGCHIVNGRGGQIGPEHTDLASRLKREWIEQWLENPQAIQPDVRMPRFKFENWEFEALTNYLMTLGKYRFVQPKY